MTELMKIVGTNKIANTTVTDICAVWSQNDPPGYRPNIICYSSRSMIRQ